MRRIVVFGNAGSGKTTLARALTSQYGLAHLDLDSLAWDSPGVRRPSPESAIAIHDFIEENLEWVIEGCYGDLLEQVMSYASEVRFLNPGLEVCLANCRARPWEPEKYPSKEAQDEKLEFLLGWVRQYQSRTDEYSLARHRALFEAFRGPKIELSFPPDTV
jgi:adenylate kinase family enzyme